MGSLNQQELISILTLSAVDGGAETCSGQTKD